VAQRGYLLTKGRAASLNFFLDPRRQGKLSE